MTRSLLPLSTRRTRGAIDRPSALISFLAALLAIGSVASAQERPSTPDGLRVAAVGASSATPKAAPTSSGAPAKPLVARSVRSGHVRLRYEIGPGSVDCDSEALFRKILASEMVEPDPFVPTGPIEGEVIVRLSADTPGYRSFVELRDLAGAVLAHGDYVDRSCHDAADRAVMTLMLEVFPVDMPPPTPPAPPPAPAPAPSPPDRTEELARAIRSLKVRLDAQGEKNEEYERKIAALERALEEERKRKMDLTFALSAGALMTANLTSNVGPGVWLGGDVRTGPISLGLEARGVLPSPVFLGSYDFDLSQIVALLTPCGRYSVFFGCAVAGAGIEIHSKMARTTIDEQSGPVLQIGGRLGAEYFFGDSPFGARVWGEVLYSAPDTYRTLSRADGSTLDWTRPNVSAFFGLGLAVRFESGSASHGER